MEMQCIEDQFQKYSHYAESVQELDGPGYFPYCLEHLLKDQEVDHQFELQMYLCQAQVEINMLKWEMKGGARGAREAPGIDYADYE